jgi:hypothetical protein
MSEKIVHLRNPQFCDICGLRIRAGKKCRLIRDDFMPMLVFFEHICCPASKQAKRTESPGASNAAGNT